MQFLPHIDKAYMKNIYYLYTKILVYIKRFLLIFRTYINYKIQFKHKK